MALRKIQTISDAAHTGFAVVIYRDSEWNEFRYRLVRAGVQDKDSDGFADTKEDAIKSARAMIEHAARVQLCTRIADQKHDSMMAYAYQQADINRLPLTVCWIDGACFRSIVSESAARFGLVSILPFNYFA